MPDVTIAPTPLPSGGDGVRDYLLDMMQQLARLARSNGETQIAILLDAVVAAEAARGIV